MSVGSPASWLAELPAARREQLLEQSADWVVRKGLEAPTLMFLEMHKPLTTLASVTYAMGQPPLMLLFGFRRTEELRLLLSERENVEALMQRIERRSRERRAPANGTPPNPLLYKEGETTVPPLGVPPLRIRGGQGESLRGDQGESPGRRGGAS